MKFNFPSIFRKLKNRVAAQTSRDRKKAKMDEMDYTIKLLTQENDTLKSKFSCLTVENQTLSRRNNELEQQLQEITKRLDGRQFNESCSMKKEAMDSESMPRWMGCGINTFENGSAESNTNPLPKGTPLKPQSIQQHAIDDECNSQKFQQTLNKKLSTMSETMSNSVNTDSAALWKIIALCLLYRTCSKISMPADWKNLPKVCSQMSQQTLKIMLQEAATHLPKLKATQSQCLDQWWGPKQKTWNPAKIRMGA